MAENKEKCGICSAYLFEDDDVVCCPVCGAPHHRDCYSAVGHCGLEEFHGTERQYKRVTVDETQKTEKEEPKESPLGDNTRCMNCGHELTGDRRFCSNCGAPAGGQGVHNMPFFAGMPQVSDTTFVEEGVSTKDVAKTVHVNPFRYIQKFITLNKNHKRSWNWAAFLMPNVWFAYRKMYKESILTTLLLVASTLCSLPFNMALYYLPEPPETVTNYLQLGQYYAGYIDQIGMPVLILAAAGLVFSLIVRFVSGALGDWIYKNRVVDVVKKVKAEDDEEEREVLWHKLGGTTFFGMLIALLAYEFLPAIVQMIILSF